MIMNRQSGLVLHSKKIKQFRFYFQDNTVIMLYNMNCIAFHSFGNPNKKSLKHFAEAIQRSRNMDIDRVFYLAHRYNIPSMYVSKSAIKESK